MSKGDDFSYFNDTVIMNALQLFSHRINLAGCIITTLIAIVGVPANGTVVFKVARHKNLRTKNNFFIANLAAADAVLFLALVIPEDVHFFTELDLFWNKGPMVVVQYIQHVCIQATAIILCCMSFSRYTMVVFPLKAKVRWTTVKVWICCAASWLVSFLIYIPLLRGILFTPAGDYNRVETKVFASITLLILFILPFSVIVFCYTQIILSFRKGRHKVRKNSNIDAESSVHQSRKLTGMVLIIICIFFVSWAPVQCYMVWMACREHNLPTSPANWRLIDIVSACSRITACLGGAVNPFVYAYTNPSFKKSNMFRLRKGSQSTMTTGTSVRYEAGKGSTRSTRTDDMQSCPEFVLVPRHSHSGHNS